jgi:hypothetical protein
MDCERFDEYVMDAVYGELDELSAEALKRHVEGCPRCNSVLTSLRSTRAALQLPVVPPSDDLHERILEAERVAVRRLPLHRKLVRAAAWAGSHAMRPQLAMAAVLMLVVGSSMMLLRARPGSIAPPVTVLEEGRPASDEQTKAPSDAAESELAPANKSRKGDGLVAGAPQAASRALEEKAGEGSFEAQDARDAEGNSREGKDADKADKALERALGIMETTGCDQAVPALEEVEKAHPGSKAATRARDAMRECRAASNTLLPAASAPATGEATATATASAPAAPAASAKRAP